MVFKGFGWGGILEEVNHVFIVVRLKLFMKKKDGSVHRIWYDEPILWAKEQDPVLKKNVNFWILCLRSTR